MNWERQWQANRLRSEKSDGFDFGADDFSADFDVAAVQARLNAHGANPPLQVDGIAGPATTAAVRAFQESQGLTVDGIIGPQTLAALGLSQEGPSAGVSGRNILGLKPIVLSKLPQIFGVWEGSGLAYMYTDRKGFVTTGTGNLIDPVERALALPWKRSDGSLASPEEITQAWQTVKNAWPGVQSTACSSLTELRLSKSDIDNLVRNTALSFYATLKGYYPGIDSWPADAQLAILSIAWAWGPAFHAVWDKYNGLGTAFRNAVNRKKPDFVTASHIMLQASAHEEQINPGIVARDQANVKMLKNAHAVIAKNSDYTNLYYPATLAVGLLTLGTLLGIAGIAVGVMAYREYKGTGNLIPRSFIPTIPLRRL